MHVHSGLLQMTSTNIVFTTRRGFSFATRSMMRSLRLLVLLVPSKMAMDPVQAPNQRNTSSSTANAIFSLACVP